MRMMVMRREEESWTREGRCMMRVYRQGGRRGGRGCGVGWACRAHRPSGRHTHAHSSQHDQQVTGLFSHHADYSQSEAATRQWAFWQACGPSVVPRSSWPRVPALFTSPPSSSPCNSYVRCVACGHVGDRQRARGRLGRTLTARGLVWSGGGVRWPRLGLARILPFPEPDGMRSREVLVSHGH
jgi:hypothetical protein